MNGFVIAFLLFPLIGAAVSRRNWGEAYLLGAGLLGALLFFCGLLDVPMLATIVVATLAALAIVIDRRRSLPERVHYPILPTIVLAIPLLVASFNAVIAPAHDFDGRAFWLLKAKVLAADERLDGPFFHGRGTYDPRNTYPLLLPLDGAAIMRIAKERDDYQLRGFYFLFFAALLLHLRERLGRRFSPEAGAWCAAIVAWLPQFAVRTEGSAVSAYSDLPMGAFMTGALFDLIDDEAPSWRFGLWLVFITLTKSEGLPYAIVLLVAAALLRRKRLAPVAILFGTAAFSLLYWRSGIDRSDEELYHARLGELLHATGRVGAVVRGMAAHFLSLRVWGLFWIAVLAGAACLIARGRWRTARLPLAILGAILAVYFGVYLVTVWQPRDLIDASLDRLLMHLIGPAMLLIASAVSPHEVDEAPLHVD